MRRKYICIIALARLICNKCLSSAGESVSANDNVRLPYRSTVAKVGHRLASDVPRGTRLEGCTRLNFRPEALPGFAANWRQVSAGPSRRNGGAYPGTNSYARRGSAWVATCAVILVGAAWLAPVAAHAGWDDGDVYQHMHASGAMMQDGRSARGMAEGKANIEAWKQLQRRQQNNGRRAH
jgi:hypothetical protein